MDTIPIPITGAFDCKIIELADRFQDAKPGDDFKLCLYDTGTVTVDAALAFYDVVRSRPKGIGVHIHEVQFPDKAANPCVEQLAVSLRNVAFVGLRS